MLEVPLEMSLAATANVSEDLVFELAQETACGADGGPCRLVVRLGTVLGLPTRGRHRLPTPEGTRCGCYGRLVLP